MYLKVATTRAGCVIDRCRPLLQGHRDDDWLHAVHLVEDRLVRRHASAHCGKHALFSAIIFAFLYGEGLLVTYVFKVLCSRKS